MAVEANLNPSHQVNPILHKYKRLYGTLYVGLGELLYSLHTIATAMARCVNDAQLGNRWLTSSLGRQARRSIRTTTITKLLHGHVKQIPPVSQAFYGSFSHSPPIPLSLLRLGLLYTSHATSTFPHALLQIGKGDKSWMDQVGLASRLFGVITWGWGHGHASPSCPFAVRAFAMRMRSEVRCLCLVMTRPAA